MVLRFVQQLFEDGRVRLQDSEPASPHQLRQATLWIVENEPNIREHLPLTPPAVEAEAVEWAVSMFYPAGQLAVFRQLGAEEIERRLRQPGPKPTPATVYSVDLVFRFLPDLLRIVKGMNPDDPLVSVLQDWSRAWPLSSIGIPDIGEINIEPILADRCLSRMYADRIIESADDSRLNDPRVAELVRGAIGAYPELSPKLHQFLTTADKTPSTVDTE